MKSKINLLFSTIISKVYTQQSKINSLHKYPNYFSESPSKNLVSSMNTKKKMESLRNKIFSSQITTLPGPKEYIQRPEKAQELLLPGWTMKINLYSNQSILSPVDLNSIEKEWSLILFIKVTKKMSEIMILLSLKKSTKKANIKTL